MEKLLLITACISVVMLMIFTHANAAVKESVPHKILIVYYSYTGNTRTMANLIKEISGGDIAEISPVTPYTSDRKALADQVRAETASNYKPEIQTHISDLESYDTIIIGSPNWCSTIAPPVATFLTDNNLSGKTILPFMTHKGTAMGNSEEYIRELCPDAKVLQGLPVFGDAVVKSKDIIIEWLRSADIIN